MPKATDATSEQPGQLFQKEHMHKMIKQLRSTGKQLKFAFGINSQSPESSVLLLSRKGTPDKLYRELRGTGQFSNRQMMCGVASSSPSQVDVLQFHLSASDTEPPQVLKVGRAFLRSDKKLKFRKLQIVLPDGKTLEDVEPEDGAASTEGLGTRRLDRELAAARKMSAAWNKALEVVAGQIEKIREAIAAENDPSLAGISERLAEVVSEFPDLDLSKLIEDAQANDREAYDQTLTQTAEEVREVYRMLSEGPVLSTIDENPYVKTNVHPTVKIVLQRVKAKLTG